MKNTPTENEIPFLVSAPLRECDDIFEIRGDLKL